MNIRNFKRAGMILIHEDTYLVVQGKMSDKWSFPKGHRENNEMAIDTARRELKEETGITLDNINEKLVNIITYYNNDYVYFCYKLDNIISVLKINDNKEIKDVRWVKLDDLKLPKYDKNCTLRLYIKNYKF